MAGYRVYYGTVSGTYLQARGSGIATGNQTSYVLNGLPKGYLYYFAVTAFDASGNESDFSTEASKLVQ